MGLSKEFSRIFYVSAHSSELLRTTSKEKFPIFLHFPPRVRSIYHMTPFFHLTSPLEQLSRTPISNSVLFLS